MSASSTRLGASSSGDRLIELIADLLNVPSKELSDASTPETARNWDSINHVRLITALESEFDIVLSINETMTLQSIGDIRRVLHGHGVSL